MKIVLDGRTIEFGTSGSSGKDYTAGLGIKIDEDEISAVNPTRGIIAEEEWTALSEEERNTGMYIIIGESSDSDVQVSSSEIYSTEEQVVGRWIDGRPLYRKVYITTSPSRIGAYDTKILDLDENVYVWKIDGMLVCDPADGSVVPVNFAHGGTAFTACWFKENLHCINMMVGVTVQVSRPVYLYLTYTKTTDEALITLATDANTVQTQAYDLYSDYDEEVAN